MSILDKLDQGPTRLPKKCKTAVILATLDTKLADKIESILESINQNTGEYNTNWLSITLREEGVFLNHQTLSRHARKVCCCYAN